VSEGPDYVKVRVPLTRDENTWHSFDTEGLWAIPDQNGFYRINNIPFYAHGISNGDVVSVAEGADCCLYVDRIQEFSEFSTVRLWVHDSSHRAAACREFEALGCDYEPADDHLLSLSIPASLLKQAMMRIEAGTESGHWEWEEGSLRD
jgi:hypothetical protein